MKPCGTRSAEWERRVRQRRVDASRGHIGTDYLPSCILCPRNWPLQSTCRTTRYADWWRMSGIASTHAERPCEVGMATARHASEHPPLTPTETRQSNGWWIERLSLSLSMYWMHWHIGPCGLRIMIARGSAARATMQCSLVQSLCLRHAVVSRLTMELPLGSEPTRRLATSRYVSLARFNE